ENVFFAQMPFENTYGHAALLTTARDLLIWNNSWRDTAFWGEIMVALRMGRGVLANGDSLNYAAGVNIGTYKNHKEVSHAGLTAGYRAWLAYYPDLDISVIYVSNNSSISIDAVHKFFLETLYGPERDDRPTAQKSLISVAPNFEDLILNDYVGEYYNEQCNGTISIIQENDALYVYRNFSEIGRLTPENKDRFVLPNEVYMFKRGITGQIERLFVSLPNAKNVSFKRLRHSTDHLQTRA